jgi:hypothetical protein
MNGEIRSIGPEVRGRKQSCYRESEEWEMETTADCGAKPSIFLAENS